MPAGFKNQALDQSPNMGRVDLPGSLTFVCGVSGSKQDSPRSTVAGDSVVAATTSSPQKISVTCFKSDEKGPFILVLVSFTDLHKYTERSEKDRKG